MATQTEGLTRDRLAALPTSYFKAVDAQDVAAIVAHFAEDATLTVQTDGGGPTRSSSRVAVG